MATSLTLRELGEYSATLDSLSETAQENLKTMMIAELRTFYRDMPASEWRALRERLVDDFHELLRYWCDASGSAASELYDKIIGQRVKQVAIATLPKALERDLAERAVRVIAAELFNGNMDKFMDKMKAVIAYHTKRYANSTMLHNAKRDKKYGVRFARVPTGHETCAFCIMLASRGFVYHNEETAGENDHFHNHCDCRIIPGLDGDEVEGYDPNAYYEFYSSNKVESGGAVDRDATINSMRRVIYEENGDHIRQQKREWYARNKPDQKNGAKV